MKFMSEIESEHIVSMIEAIQTKDYLFIVMEYCEGGNLMEYLNKNPKLEFKDKKRIIYDILMGLLDLSAEGVVHRDIKLENILMS